MHDDSNQTQHAIFIAETPRSSACHPSVVFAFCRFYIYFADLCFNFFSVIWDVNMSISTCPRNAIMQLQSLA